MVCGSRHGTHNAMYLHILWKHPEKKIRKCRLCKKHVECAVKGFRAHFEECHSEEVLKCEFCEKIFVGSSRLIYMSQHMKKDHSGVAFRCAWNSCCRYIVYFQVSMIYKSDVCYRYFSTRAAMEKHATEKHNNLIARKKLECIFCDANFLNISCLQIHVRQKHKREAQFCPRNHCGRYYKTSEEMQAHFKVVHDNRPNEEKIACIICSRRISSIR